MTWFWSLIEPATTDVKGRDYHSIGQPGGVDRLVDGDDFRIVVGVGVGVEAFHKGPFERDRLVRLRYRHIQEGSGDAAPDLLGDGRSFRSCRTNRPWHLRGIW